MNCGVYTITTPSGGRYVGSAYNFNTRWKRHRYHLNKGIHSNPKLQNAWKKYKGQFIFSKLLVCSEDCVLMYEAMAIGVLKPIYNIMTVAENNSGFTHSQETRNKLGKISSRAIRTPEWKAALSKSNTGQKRTAETCANIGKSKKGTKQSPEHVASRNASITKAAKDRPERSLEEKFRISNIYKEVWAEKRRLGTMPIRIASEETKAKLRAAWVIRRMKAKHLETQ
jgi:group I intron endonuclease